MANILPSVCLLSVCFRSYQFCLTCMLVLHRLYKNKYCATGLSAKQSECCYHEPLRLCNVWLIRLWLWLKYTVKTESGTVQGTSLQAIIMLLHLKLLPTLTAISLFLHFALLLWLLSFFNSLQFSGIYHVYCVAPFSLQGLTAFFLYRSLKQFTYLRFTTEIPTVALYQTCLFNPGTRHSGEIKLNELFVHTCVVTYCTCALEEKQRPRNILWFTHVNYIIHENIIKSKDLTETKLD